MGECETRTQGAPIAQLWARRRIAPPSAAGQPVLHFERGSRTSFRLEGPAAAGLNVPLTLRRYRGEVLRRPQNGLFDELALRGLGTLSRGYAVGLGLLVVVGAAIGATRIGRGSMSSAMTILTHARPGWLLVAGVGFAVALLSSAAAWRAGLRACGGRACATQVSARYGIGSGEPEGWVHLSPRRGRSLSRHWSWPPQRWGKFHSGRPHSSHSPFSACSSCARASARGPWAVSAASCRSFGPARARRAKERASSDGSRARSSPVSQPPPRSRLR